MARHKGQYMRRVMLAFLTLAVLLGPSLAHGFALEMLQTAAAQGGDRKTILDGVYTAAQGARGETSYAMHCSSCHSPDLTGFSAPPLTGSQFVDNWREYSLDPLYTLIRDTMPRNAEKLAESTYIDILAYILQRNEYPAGPRELTADAVGTVRFVGRNGPAPVPEYALIQVVGCLAQRPDGVWVLNMATDPIRIRDQAKSTPDQLSASAARPLGNQTFRLVYPDFAPGFQAAAHNGHKMEAKGYLLINPVDQRLSVTWMERVADGCQ
jgi:mono/diheme cytochrome c family protein